MLSGLIAIDFRVIEMDCCLVFRFWMNNMITKIYKFSVSTIYVDSEVTEDVEIEFKEEDYNNKERREVIIEKWYKKWMLQNVIVNWEEIS